MSKVEHFRSIRPAHPDIVERLIALWGTRDLGVYINSVLREASAGLREPLAPRLQSALMHLKDLHDAEFPKLAVNGMPDIPDELITDDFFQEINREFPHIARRLTVTWGQKAFSEYVNDLINNRRDGHRQGFPKRIALALFNLMLKHDRCYPEHEIKVGDIWQLNNER